MDKLAIDAYQAQIKALKGNFILQASPGSGKSTRVPVMLHTAHAQKVIVLEPRRMAAKFAALRVAAEQGWEVGKEVGYVFRWEKMAGPETKITYFTEGSFVRYLLAHPDLPGVGTVLLDEFHERHLETDLALAMLRNIARPIQLGLMSATLDLGESQSLRDISQSVLNIEAPSYPLQLHYLAQEDQGKNLVARVVNALLEAWEQEGDILVFLPGLAEIRQVATAIEKDEDFKAATLILHGERSLAEQQAVLAPRKERKIILATNIAESSLTIPGIKIVIDSGLERTVAYHALSQTSRLTTQNISQASAIQRAARGNRQGAGQCWRLYTEDEFQSWPSHALPEIQRSDLTSAYLLAAAWPNKLVWPIEPPVLAQQSAQQILCRLNALDEQNHLTSLGKELSKWPLHPRQALMMLHACLAQEEVAQEVINFIARGMSLKSDVAKFDPRLQQRLQQRWKKDKDRIKQNSSQIFGTSAASFLSDASRWTLEQIVFWAYFDHLALWRPKTHNFTHAQGITLVPAKNILDELAHQHEWWCVLDLDGQGKVSSMIPVEKDWAYLLPCSPLVEKEELVFAEAKNKVMQHSEVWLDHLVLERQAFAPRPDQQKDVTNLLLKHAKRMINDWFSSEQGHRGQYILKTLNASPSMANDAWADLLAPAWWENLLAHTDQIPEGLADYFLLQLEQELEQQHGIDLAKSFPEEVHLANGKSLPITYCPGEPPFIAAYIQDFYGVEALPSFKWPQQLVAKLLGPHQRPIQVTADLASFWHNTYPAFKKEWSREYPRHYWPDDPAHALPVLLKKRLPSMRDGSGEKNSGKEKKR